MSLLESILQIAATDPAGIAGVEGTERLSYQELSEASLTLRKLLFELGLRPGHTAALLLPNSLESMVSVLAVLRLGADLLLLDPALKPGEVTEFCRSARVSLILCRDSGNEEEEAAGPRQWTVPRVRTLLANQVAERAEEAGATPALPASAFLLLSSGTTGRPKLVRRTAEQAEAAVQIFESQLPGQPYDRVLAAMPFFHSFGLLFTLLVTLRSGGTLYLEAFTPRGTAKAIEQDRITVFPATPFIFRMLAETRFDPVPSFASLRLAISAGTGLSVAVSAAFKTKFGIGILQSYGSTESGPVALGSPQDRVDRPGWVGRPYPGVEVDYLHPGPFGETAAPILVRSPANASGYFGDAETSRMVFRKGAVLMGDLGYQDDSGTLFVLGRERPMLNVAGKKVSPAEVEACLKSHPGIWEATVSGVPAPDGGDRIRAVLGADPSLGIQEIQAFVAQRIAEFKVPREILIVGDEAWTALGKIRYQPPEAAGGGPTNLGTPPATAEVVRPSKNMDRPRPSLRDVLRQSEPDGIEMCRRSGKVIENYLRLLVGDVPAPQLRLMAAQTAVRYGKNQILVKWRKDGRFREMLPLIRYQGEAELLDMLRTGQPAIFVFLHFGPSSAIPIALNGMGIPTLGLHNISNSSIFGPRPQPMPFYELWEAEEGSLEEALFLKQAVTRMKQGTSVLLAADGNLGAASAQLPFLDRRMGYYRGAALLHRITKAPIIPLSMAWAPEDDFLDFRVHPPLVAASFDPAGKATEEGEVLSRIALWAEALVRADPGQTLLTRLIGWTALPSGGQPGVDLSETTKLTDPGPRIHRIDVGGFH